MKKIIVFICLSLFTPYLFAQISTILPSSSSIAETSVSNIHNQSAFTNPAMLGYLENPEISFNFENKFLIPELATKSLQAGFSTKLVNFGFSFSHFGYSLYNEMLIGVGLARNFSDKFAMGVQFNYYTAYLAATNSYRGALLPQVGLSVKLSPVFSLGFNTFNPFQTNINTDFVVKRIPSVFSLGTEFYFSPELVWRTQVDKEVSSNYRFATGFEYQMIENLSVKLGAYGSDYLIPCLGIELNFGSFLFDLNCELHPLLGMNTLAAVKYKFGSRR